MNQLESQIISYPTEGDLYHSMCNWMVQLAKPIRETNWVMDVALTGAAGFLRFALWAEPGASVNLLGERLTYAQQHTDEHIGRPPPHGRYSRLASALSMAAASYSHASRVAFQRDLKNCPVMGVAMTAAAATNRQRRGVDACRIAVRTKEGFHFVDVVFDKAHERQQNRSQRRLEEGILCDLLTLLVMLRVMNLPVPRLDPSWGIQSEHLQQLADGSLALQPESPQTHPLAEVSSPFYKVLMPNQEVVALNTLDPKAYIMFPGSFNPLHHGHQNIAKMAHEQTGKDVLFSLTAHHPGKGIVDTVELLRRAKQLQFRWPVVLLDKEGLFVDKAKLVPGMDILIGADVVYGLQNLSYYNHDKAQRRAMFHQLSDLKTQFLVAGRQVEGHYETLSDIPIPSAFAQLFRPLGGRMDISSSQLRKS